MQPHDTPSTPACKVDGCKNPVTARGLCPTHYYHLTRQTEMRLCSVTDCTEPIRTRGYCNKHYTQFQRTGDPTFKAAPKPKQSCSVEDCADVVLAKGLCNKHYIRLKNHGDVSQVSSPSDTRNIVICAECGKSFPAKPSKNRQFCSNTCRGTNERGSDQTCLICGKAFRANPAKLARGNGKYCSTTCAGIAKRGPEICSVGGCNGKTLANGFCRRHDPKSIETAHRSAHKRRSKLLNAFVAPVSRDEIYQRDSGICYLCQQPVERSKMTIDHVVPLALGGRHEPSNIRLAHKSCNSKRGIRYTGQLPLPFIDKKPEYKNGHPRSLLSDDQAREAYQLCRDGANFNTVARQFGVSSDVIRALCRGSRRKHLKLLPL